MKHSIDKHHIRQLFPQLCAPRERDSHKGSFGTVGIIGGAEGMSGAAMLAGAAALMGGCGKVILGFAQNKIPLAVWQEMPELIIQTAEELLNSQNISAWVVGCGLGQSEDAFLRLEKMMIAARSHQIPIVFDADALNLLAKMRTVSWRGETRVLTPHPGEAARLLQTHISSIQQDRELSAAVIAKKYHAWVVLKGNQTVISSPEGDIKINQSGNPNLAVAGSGDVLAGLIGSLLAQSIAVPEAVEAAVWLHGQAADNLAKEGLLLGLKAMELCYAIRAMRNDLLQD